MRNSFMSINGSYFKTNIRKLPDAFVNFLFWKPFKNKKINR